MSVDSKSQQHFAKSSLAKARKYLNALMVKFRKEMDDKLIGCIEFEDKNRVTFNQVMTQIATLAVNLADLAKIKERATEMINVKEQELITTKSMLKKETGAYMKIYLANKAEMKIRKYDLVGCSFMLQESAKELQLTKATDGTIPVTAGLQTQVQDGTYRDLADS